MEQVILRLISVDNVAIISSIYGGSPRQKQALVTNNIVYTQPLIPFTSFDILFMILKQCEYPIKVLNGHIPAQLHLLDGKGFIYIVKGQRGCRAIRPRTVN